MRWLWVGVIAAVAAGAALAGFLLWPRDGQDGYVTATAERGDIEDLVTASGTLQPRDYVDVGTQVSGQLMKLYVDVGAEVKQGALLAEIDPAVYRARVDADRAQLNNLQAQLLERQAQLTLAQQQAERQHNLAKEDATTDEALQTAEATLQSARAQVAALNAQIEQTESTLRGDEANLSYTKIYAPMSGTVVSLSAKQGQTLNANQQAPIILRIADLAIMTVQTQVSEADVGKLRLGMEVYFTTLGNREHRWYGKLRQILPTPETLNNVVLYNALFDVPNPDKQLMTQMTAQVFFVVASARDAVLVPVGALQPAGGRPAGESGKAGAAARADGAAAPQRQGGPRRARGTVVRVVRAGKVEARPVEVGVTNRISAQILRGVEPGEEVVVGVRQPEARPAEAGQGGRPRFPPRL
jgi:macrolide-specific efflux system membrane fusion protein